jgi:hypothetical protein
VPGNPQLEADLRNSRLSQREVAKKHSASKTAVKRWRDAHNIPRMDAFGVLTEPYPVTDTQRPAAVRHKPVQTQQWQPGITITDTAAEIRTPYRAFEQTPDDAALLTEAGLNPDEWYITKTTSHVKYGEDGEPSVAQYWLRASKIPAGSISTEDLDAILAQYIKPPWELPGNFGGADTKRILVVPTGDLQLGKPSGGGTEATVARFARYTNDIAADLAASGGVQLLVLPVLGDCVEGIVSQSGRNIAYLDMPITAQVRVYRRLLMHQLLTLAPYAQNVLVPVVPGNHDETTRQQIMPHTDSWAIEGASAAADFLSGREGFEHVSWAFPDAGEPHLAVKIAEELTLGFTHGHVTGTNPAKVIDWWGRQSHGRQPVGEADILFSAHWHHLRVEFTGGGRTWFQIPAMDGGSDWYRHKTGDDVMSGQITVDLTPGAGCGWTNLQVYT